MVRRPGRRRAEVDRRRWRRGRSARWRSSRRSTPGSRRSAWPERRPRPAGRRVLPSYVAGALVVVLVYLHGRLWRGAGVGLFAALLTGFNRNLLVQMQQATPTTLGLAGDAGGACSAYGRHLRGGVGVDAAAGPGAAARSWAVARRAGAGAGADGGRRFGLVGVRWSCCTRRISCAGRRRRADRPIGRWLARLAGQPERDGRGAGAGDRAWRWPAPGTCWMVARHGRGWLGALLAPFDAGRPGIGRACSRGWSTWLRRRCRWACSPPSGRSAWP